MAREVTYPVDFHSDWRQYAVSWCKQNLHKTQWVHTRFSNVYEDMMFFEFETDAKKFSNYMKKITRKG
jgi:hypothetical protein